MNRQKELDGGDASQSSIITTRLSAQAVNELSELVQLGLFCLFLMYFCHKCLLLSACHLLRYN